MKAILALAQHSINLKKLKIASILSLLADLQEASNADISFDATLAIEALTASSNAGNIVNSDGQQSADGYFIVPPANGCNSVSTYLNTVQFTIESIDGNVETAAFVERTIAGLAHVVSVSVDPIVNRATIYSNKYSTSNCAGLIDDIAKAGFIAAIPGAASGYVDYPGPVKAKSSLALAVYQDVENVGSKKVKVKPSVPKKEQGGLVQTLASWFF